MVHSKHTTRGKPRIEMKGEPRYRSRSFRKVQLKTPGNRTVVHYVKRNAAFAKCAVCKSPLHGLPRGTNAKVKHFSRTQLTIQRPFGANLCSSCSRDVIKWRARMQHKLGRSDEVPIVYKQFIKVKA